MAENHQHGYGTVEAHGEEYEGRVMTEAWTRPKQTVLLELWGMSGEKTDDLDCYLYFTPQEARWLGTQLIEMARSAMHNPRKPRETAWVDHYEQAMEEPLIDGAGEYADECTKRRLDARAQKHLGLLQLEDEDGEWLELTDEHAERFREVLLEEFGYEEATFETASKEDLLEALNYDDPEDDD